MKYKNAIITLGVLIAVILSPFIGIARSWKEGIAMILALFVSVLAYIGARPRVQSQVVEPKESPVPVLEPEPERTSDVSSNPQ